MSVDPKLIALGALVCVIGFGAGYFYQSEPHNPYLNPDVVLTLDQDCGLNQASCERAINETASIQFSIEPRPIMAVSPLVFSLDSRHLDIESAVIDLSGTDMNMGNYRFELKPDGQRDGVDQFIAEGNLPVCVRNQMDWQADVWLQTKQQGLIKVPHVFTAYKPR